MGLLAHYGRNITGDPTPKVDIPALPPTSWHDATASRTACILIQVHLLLYSDVYNTNGQSLILSVSLFIFQPTIHHWVNHKQVFVVFVHFNHIFDAPLSRLHAVEAINAVHVLLCADIDMVFIMSAWLRPKCKSCSILPFVRCVWFFWTINVVTPGPFPTNNDVCLLMQVVSMRTIGVTCHFVHKAGSLLQNKNEIKYVVLRCLLTKRYCLTSVLIIWPDSSSIRYLPSFSDKNPSWPWAIYSLVTILYFLPVFSCLTSWSCTWRWPELMPSCSTSFCCQIPMTRCPGGFRESHKTRKPDITGKRLQCNVVRLVECLESQLTLLGLAKSQEKLLMHSIYSHHLILARRLDLRMAISPKCPPVWCFLCSPMLVVPMLRFSKDSHLDRTRNPHEVCRRKWAHHLTRRNLSCREHDRRNVEVRLQTSCLLQTTRCKYPGVCDNRTMNLGCPDNLRTTVNFNFSLANGIFQRGWDAG